MEGPRVGGRSPSLAAASDEEEEEAGVRDVVESEEGAYDMVVEESNRLGRLALRRGSFLGRNLKGVWRTEGAEDGGLKMI